MKQNNIAAAPFGVALFIILALFLISCTTAKKATDFMQQHPQVGAQYCAAAFPPKDSVGGETIVYVPAENIDYSPQIDSLNKAIDSLNTSWTNVVDSATGEVQVVFRKEILKQQTEVAALRLRIAQLNGSYKPCIPDTVKKEVPHYISNTAKEYQLATENGELRMEKEKLEHSLDKWRLWCLITWSACALYVVLRIKRLIPV